jgi:hypothetical protein
MSRSPRPVSASPVSDEIEFAAAARKLFRAGVYARSVASKLEDDATPVLFSEHANGECVRDEKVRRHSPHGLGKHNSLNGLEGVVLMAEQLEVTAGPGSY